MLQARVRRLMVWSPALGQITSGRLSSDHVLLTDPEYAVTQIQERQARRFSGLSKVSIDLGLRAMRAGDGGLECNPDHLVFSSRHGELANTAQLLAMIGKGEVLSPILFSQSVHNSALGNLGLLAKTRVPATAIGGGRDSFVAGLISSAAYLQENPGATVLYISADYRAPDTLAGSLREKNESFAVAAILDAGTDGEILRLSQVSDAGSVTKGEDPPEPQALEFARWYFSTENKLHLRSDTQQAWDLQR